MSSKKIITYTGLLKDVYYRPKDIGSREVLRLLRQANAIPAQLLPFNGIIHLIDYTQRRHVAINGPIKDILGYRPQEVMDNGLDFVINVFQKEDFSVYNEKIFGQVTDFLRNTPQGEHGEYTFTYSYRLKKADGKWMHSFQQGSYVTDPQTNLPLYGIALVLDITPLKKDTSMMFSIDKKKSDGGYANVITNYYYPDPEESRLTRREREVLGRLAEGMSSKRIADRLFLSENTVANHRKSLLRKTNSKNVAELIRYAANKGII